MSASRTPSARVLGILSVRRAMLGLSAVAVAVACGSVPNDPGARIVPPVGVIRGTVVYNGLRPCSRDGHIVGNAIVAVFDRLDPPAPDGLASAPLNFATVTGDRLFADEPRYPGSDTVYCPADHGFTEAVTASADFEIAPLAGGSYRLQAFFDTTGDFLPEFKFRNLPERGDVAGGAIDSADAERPVNAGNPNYEPVFLPVNVGIAEPPTSASGGSASIPTYRIPDTGFVADNVTVTLGLPAAIDAPLFSIPQGEVASVRHDLRGSLRPPSFNPPTHAGWRSQVP